MEEKSGPVQDFSVVGPAKNKGEVKSSRYITVIIRKGRSEEKHVKVKFI